MSRVLLVADASWVVNEVRSSLTLGDWHVEEVADPRQATAIAASERTDAVIVDMQVGSMGGMAVVRDIRQSFLEPDRPRTVMLLDRSADEFIARRWRKRPFVGRGIEHFDFFGDELIVA